MTRRRVFWVVVALGLVVGLALAVPGSPIYLPDLMVASGHHEGHSTSYWIKTLKSPDDNVRRQAVFAVGAIGAKAGAAVPELARIMLDDPDPSMRSEAALALSKMEPASAAVEALAGALTDDDLLVRMYAATTLRRLGTAARPAVPALVAAVKDKDNDTFLPPFRMTVREMMVLALGRASAGTTEALPVLLEVLKGNDAGTVSSSASFVGMAAGTGVGLLADVSVLFEALRVSDADPVCRAAAQASGEVGPEARSAVPALETMAKKHRRLKDTVERAKEKIGVEPAGNGAHR